MKIIIGIALVLAALAGAVRAEDAAWVADRGVHDDLVAHGMPEALWGAGDTYSQTRHQVINARAKLIALGAWDQVAGITVGWVDGDRLRLDQSGFYVVLQPAAAVWAWLEARNVTHSLRERLSGRAAPGPRFFRQPNGHEEAADQLKELPKAETDLVSHFVRLKPQYGAYVTLHFDTGYGLPTPNHVIEHHVPDDAEITRGLMKDPAARPHLVGIDANTDAEATGRSGIAAAPDATPVDVGAGTLLGVSTQNGNVPAADRLPTANAKASASIGPVVEGLLGPVAYWFWRAMKVARDLGVDIGSVVLR